ncbi:hypothetical protein PGH12_17705 [Chryseobacterium wangxinyae]|uniref:hypothetical protein n=1 Tax=Chryseobacterium sp. CY350 TaxID=2997336 RepID=UPI002271A0D2|nr:hypothetical protein [Chryseobacterium sp. CY350]MCY0978196.1 hypothetical protein [Chryseobacterium sp. CY350]WBZ95280.1 hypothetical protein PGH12_17705 [Chryseobacterium sp. CY350]
MKTIFCFLSIIFSTLSFAQKEFQPKNATINETVNGDLDGDKIPEKVIVYNIPTNDDSGDIREIQILKKINNIWTILEKSRKAIYGSKDGGMMGDPYQNTTIENGILNITHYGGSSWKWGGTDKYRFQNGHFELIGISSENGKPDEYWTTVDFNLSTGKLVFDKEVTNTKEYGKSKNEIFIKKGLKINLQNRHQEKQREILLPKTKEKVYL